VDSTTIEAKKGGGSKDRRTQKEERDKGSCPLTDEAAYDTKGIRANISLRTRGGKRAKRGRPYSFDKVTYRFARSSVERFFGWLKGGFRRLALRHERLLSTIKGFIYFASFLITWRILRRVRIYLEVLENNERARKFYKKYSFEILGDV